nr:YciI family protein [uncultured Devosia sp.]
MKYMTLVKTTKAGVGAPPMALMQAIGQLGADAEAAGVLVTQGGLMGKDDSAFIAIRQGKMIITDGPFAESKELVGGYAVYDVPSKAEALEWATRFANLHTEHWPGWEGDIELRPIFG